MNDLLWVSLALGCAFGGAARISGFCLLQGLRQLLSPPSTPHAGNTVRQKPAALPTFALALGVALIGTQLLAFTGVIDIGKTLPVRARFSPLGALAGGLLFGMGMALARSCGARALVLLAGGNLRALWVLLWLGLGAQATMTGVLAPMRQSLQGWDVISPAHSTVSGWLQAASGLPPTAALLLSTAIPASLLIFLAFKSSALRQQPARWLGALVIGLLVSAGWWISAHVGVDPFAFEERPLTSLSFISPVAESWLYLQLAVGREFSAGPAMVGGVVAGAFVAALLTRTLRVEGFEAPSRMFTSAIGGLLMGFGGVVAMGCSIGQGLGGLATLSLASLPAVAGIVLGAFVVLWKQMR